jgi:hypothetical protein
MLGIEERLQRKLRQAAAVGVGEVLPGFAGQDVNFTETREEIARLRREEASLFQEGNPSALSGEEYRRTLEHELADATWSTAWKHRAPPRAASHPRQPHRQGTQRPGQGRIPLPGAAGPGDQLVLWACPMRTRCPDDAGLPFACCRVTVIVGYWVGGTPDHNVTSPDWLNVPMGTSMSAAFFSHAW